DSLAQVFFQLRLSGQRAFADLIEPTFALGITDERRRTEKREKDFEFPECFDSDFKMERKKVTGFRVPAIKAPLIAVGQNSPRQNLRFVEVVADLLVRIALLVFADLRERMVHLLGLENRHRCPVALNGASIDDFLFRLGIWIKDVIGLEILLRF